MARRVAPSRPMSRKRVAARQATKHAAPSRGTTTANAPRRAGRVSSLDALRGIALCLMVVYHFAFDLRYFRVTQADFEGDPFWLGFRALIVTMFLGLVGVSLVLAERAGVSRRHFRARIGVIVACALLASAGSWVAFPARYIYFGILHCIAVASVLAWPVVRRPRLALGIGVAVIVAGLTLAHPVFDGRALSWLGFTTRKPATEDYVPLFPWSGVVFLGIAAGHMLVRTGFRPLTVLASAPRWLAFMGRHSLLAYMVHQPVLMGALWVVVR